MAAGTVRKATKAVARTSRAAPVPDPNDVPEELRGLYGPPEFLRNKDTDVSLDFTTPSGEDIARVPMEKLFSIDGKDYFIPAVFPPGVGLVYLHGVEEGRDVALGRCLKAVIGERGWNELTAFAMRTNGGGITRAQMGRLLDVVLTKVMGALEEDGEGNG